MEHHECEFATVNNDDNQLTYTSISESVLYHGPHFPNDDHMDWASVTPRSMQHFIVHSYPQDMIDSSNSEDHYETVEIVPSKNVYPTGLEFDQAREKPTCSCNSGSTEDGYEIPTPLKLSKPSSDNSDCVNDGNEVSTQFIQQEENIYQNMDTDIRCSSFFSF